MEKEHYHYFSCERCGFIYYTKENRKTCPDCDAKTDKFGELNDR